MAKTKATKCRTCGSRFHKTADHSAVDALHAQLAQAGRDALRGTRAADHESFDEMSDRIRAEMRREEQ